MGHEIESMILGLIQGLTEWFPISSSGHLRLARILLGLEFPLLFDVTLHVGTLLVTVIFFRRDMKGMVRALIKLDFKSCYGRLMELIVLGSLSTILTSLVTYTLLGKFFSNLTLIAGAFIFSGLIVYLSKTGRKERNNVDYRSAIIIGLAQGLSILPGLSRSGLTIAAALLLSIKHEEAFRFSFLLSIPAILGALTLTLYTQSNLLFSANLEYFDLLIGGITSMIVGYFSIKALKAFLHKFYMFSFYSISLGLLIIAVELLWKI